MTPALAKFLLSKYICFSFVNLLFVMVVLAMKLEKNVLLLGPSTVAHACNPSHLGDRSRNIAVQGQPGQKQETLSGKQTKARRAGDAA
jgi:hypothetical protein